MRWSMPRSYPVEILLVAAQMGALMAIVIAVVDGLAGVPWPW